MKRFHRWLYQVPLRLRSLFRRSDVEKELDEELQFHLDKQIEVLVEKGYTADEARYMALREMRGIEVRKEECRDTRRVSVIEHAIQDLRFGTRALAKNPGFTLAVIATIALGIGATTAVFSVVYGVTMRPLPYPQSERLVGLSTKLGSSSDRIAVSLLNYQDWRAQNSVFEEIGVTKGVQNFNITGDGEPERVLGGRQTASVFRVLGVQPLLGRVFTDEEGLAEDKVVLSYDLWQRRYGSDPSIIGKKIQLNGHAYDVIGVMPREFRYRNREFALWTPLVPPAGDNRFTFDYVGIARLKPGVTMAQAQVQMSEIQNRINQTDPTFQGMGVEVFGTFDDLVEKVRTPLYLLMGAVSCLLLIGCANLANLLVARAVSRSQEFVVRAALGAGKGRLILQSIMEVVPLVFLGGICGLVLAQWMLSMLVPLLPSTMPRLESIQLDWRVLLFAGVVLSVTALVTGVWPAFQMLRWNINQALRESSRTTVSGRAARLRGGLVVSQISTVVVLLIVSMLLTRSLIATSIVDPGFRPNNILSVHLALSDQNQRSNAAFGQFCKQIVDRVRALPGVISVGMVNRLPLAGQTQTISADFEGTNLPRDAQGALRIGSFDSRIATPDYFKTLGISLIEGRFFDEFDTSDRPPVSIIDERVARLVWPNQSAIGKRLHIGGPKAPWYEIVGVVGHVRHDSLAKEQRPQIYWSYQQRVQPRMALAVRTEGDPNLLSKSVIAAIHEVDRDQPVYDVYSMDDVIDRSLSQQWLMTTLLSLFASIALVLASIGIYGVLSYSVGLRTREIGIRMALGSERQPIIGMVIRQSALLTAIGGIIGIAGSLLLGRVLRGLLYGITPTDTVSFALAALVIFIVSLAASIIPARRASRVDPMIALRQD